jgi:AcrR family transcriptional regulator
MAHKASTERKAEPQAQPPENPAAQRIITAARRHFFTHGFRGVTMDDLAEELGMSKKTLYRSFASKSDLLRAVLLDKFRSVEADLGRITSNFPADALDALHQLLACMQRHTEEIQPPFVRDIRREAPEMFKLVESRRRDLIERHFGKFFREGRRGGIIRKDIPTRVIIDTLLGATEAVMNPQKISELGLTPQTGYAAIISIILEGVITGRGRSKP